MKYYLLTLVMSVFLGSELLAISLPVGQITIYRLCALMVIPLIILSILRNDRSLKIDRKSYSSMIVVAFIIWWVWGLVSVLWAVDIAAWVQGMFLLTIGISSIIALYLWNRDLNTWQFLLKGIWVLMTFLVLLGCFEIITNHYFFADIEKLDKYNTFVTEPLTRIPITHFANQNDYATMLLSYLPVNISLYNLTNNKLKRLGYVIFTLIASLLVFQTGSRMSLIMLVVFFIVFGLLQIKLGFKRKHYYQIAIIAVVGIIGIFLIPGVWDKITGLFYIFPLPTISGDTARMNMWRNGLVFLGRTFGFGVGAGNLEVWMENFGLLPTNNINNIHNWWLEILVGYGVIVFAIYVIAYGLLIYRLLKLKPYVTKKHKQVMSAFIAFLLIFIGASITSANNMLIEWHWVFFGMMISYVAIMERKIKLKLLE